MVYLSNQNQYTFGMEKKEKKRFLTKKKVIVFSLTLLLLVLALILALIYFLRNDNNRSTYQNSDVSTEEVIKKKYIDAFKNTKNNGKFTYILTDDDINQMLSAADLPNKFEAVYYSSSSNISTFYIDLKQTSFFKTRLVINTEVTANDDMTYKVKITSLTSGKLEALNYYKKHGIFTSENLSKIIQSSALPMTYLEEENSFLIEPLKFIDRFPSSNMGNIINDLMKENQNYVALNSSLFGFDFDFSFIKSEPISEHENKNIREELLDQINSLNESSFGVKNEIEIYNISTKDFKNLCKSPISSYKEEIFSSQTQDKICFDIVGIDYSFKDAQTGQFKVVLSLNGCLVSLSIDTSISVSSNSLQFVNEIKPTKYNYLNDYLIDSFDCSISDTIKKETANSISLKIEYKDKEFSSIFAASLNYCFRVDVTNQKLVVVASK